MAGWRSQRTRPKKSCPLIAPPQVFKYPWLYIVTFKPVAKVVAAVLALIGTGWGVWYFLNRPDLSREYRVGVDHAPPYNIVISGQPVTGLAVEILRESARRKGVTLSFVRTQLQVDDAFHQGLVDLWPAATDTPARRKWLHVTEPYLANGLVIVSKADNPVTGPEQLRKKRISLLNSRILKEFVGRGVQDIETVEVRDRYSSLASLCKGEVDATIVEQRFFEQVLLDRPADCAAVRFHALNAVGMERMLSIVAARNAGAVAERLRDGITEMMNDGTFFKHLDRWSSFTGGESRTAQHLASSKLISRLYTLALAAILVLMGLLAYQNLRLRDANRRSQAAAKAKSDFLASVSHEIRTPMNGILGMTEVVLLGPLEPEQKENMQVVRQSAESLLKIINDILDVSKAEAGKLRLELAPFDVSRLARQVWTLCYPQATAKGLKGNLQLAPDIPGRLVGDPDRLRQVLLNLLSNAIKFTENGRVELSVNVASANEDTVTVRFRVQDTGVGISPNKLPKLFQKFYQADSSSTRRRGGTGLGLAISKELVQLMGGTIDVKSEVGAGSVFTVLLPLRTAVRTTTLSNESTDGFRVESPHAQIRVLLVEDNVINQRVGLRLLERLGCAVDLAATGWEAVQMVGEEDYQLVLMDCQMPEMDGYEATSLIRQRESSGKHTLIVAMTAAAVAGDRERCMNAGMDDYLSKPVQLAELTRIIEQYFAGWSKPAPADSRKPQNA